MKAVRVHQFGPAEELRYEDVAMPEPGAGQVRVKLAAAGLNFIDIYQRTGLYPVQTPLILGLEGAGTVDAVGDGVTGFASGDRVAHTGVPGSYAEYVLVPAEQLVALPDGVSTEQAAAAMLQGLTAHYLSQSTYPLKKDDRALIHAAAGGVGQLLIQMAKLNGAFVIGTVSTEEKAQLARAAGADEVILYTEQNFEEETERITAGEGVHVVYDSVGQSTFDQSLNCLRPRGYMVLYGQASGPVPPMDPQTLNHKGSLFLTRPVLGHYTATRDELLARADQMFGWMANGALKVRVDTTFPLAEAADAHRYMEARKTRGKVLLVP